LVLLVRLLCRYGKNEVVTYVNKEYFPVNECLEVVREEQCLAPEAVLMQRSGDHLQALKVYLKLLDSLDAYQMVKEINQLAGKDVGLKSSDRWDIDKCSKYNTLGEFDRVLETSCNIAEKKKGDHAVVGEEGWFAILEFLNDFIIQVR